MNQLGVQAFRRQLSVERFDEAVVGGLAKPGEARRELIGLGLQMGFAAIVDHDPPLVADLFADPFQGLDLISPGKQNVDPSPGNSANGYLRWLVSAASYPKRAGHEQSEGEQSPELLSAPPHTLNAGLRFRRGRLPHNRLLARSIMPLLLGKSSYPGCSNIRSRL